MKKTSNKPTHRAYAVTKRGEKSYWNAIGAVWTHKDGKGFSLALDYLPLNDAEIVIREPSADENAPADAITSEAAAA